MQFTRLKLNGFKSFVDQTDLVIANGLTGVVGPNGCGKSNLLEALRWVMGENRPSAMRGGGMEDVIFSGTATRPARSFAEVILQVDNTDRLAPAAFNDADQLEVVRRITRDAGSAYKTNGKDARARDVQMLFADASSGAHSPALVRQGQIAELINAKPKNRRRILEEAAGISGLYQRRHEAELKLNGAESNLARVDDVLEALAQQLSTLERQARQAKRYREIGADLRRAEGVLLYLKWRDADRIMVELAQSLTEQMLQATAAERQAQEAQAAREAADAALPPKREEAAIAAAVLQRIDVEHSGMADEARRVTAAISALEGRLSQLDLDISREGNLTQDAQDSMARLAQEKAELDEKDTGAEAALSEALERAETAAATLQERETALSALTEDAANLAARHQSAERRLDDAERAVARHRKEVDQTSQSARGAEGELAQARQSHERAQADLAAAVDLVGRADETLSETELARSEVQAQEGEARAALSESAGHAKTLSAQVQALTKLIERERGDTRQALEDIRVAPGYEVAMGAALADDLKLPLSPGGAESGWIGLPPLEAQRPLPGGIPALADYVDMPDILQRRLSQIGVVEPEQGAKLQAQLHQGQRLVSRAGDLWRWDGFVQIAADLSSTAGRRLEQANELAALQDELAHAETAAERAQDAHTRLSTRLTALTEADSAARKARREAEARMTEASRASSRAEAECNILSGRVETLHSTAARHADEATRAEAELQAAAAAAASLDSLDALRAQVTEAREGVEAARLAMIARRTAHQDLKRDIEDRIARLAKIEAEVADWKSRSETAEARMADVTQRRANTAEELERSRTKPAEIEARQATLQDTREKAQTRKTAAEEDLSTAEIALRQAVQVERDAQNEASQKREARARVEAQHDAAKTAVAEAVERIEQDLQMAPGDMLEALEIDPESLGALDRVENDIARLRRQRDALGAVNLRAEEDAEAVQIEHDALRVEKSDLEEAIAKLRKAIAALNKEGRQRLLDAFDQVNESFGTLFKHLFDGGEAKLVLVESDDPLEAGLEILCQPPGKKLATLSLLSGGEQTLTALALIFAVFLANPAPICVLDEVDAPLDDANVTRFCDLLDEMCRRTNTRFLIITHHAVTMARMDRLFGVTMAEQGVSQLVSVDLNKAEQMVA
ncbi:MAG: AAA family ATPase [Pseudomonadota bacterium]